MGDDDGDDDNGYDDNGNDNGGLVGVERGPELNTGPSGSNTGSVYHGNKTGKKPIKPIELIGHATFFNFLCAVFSRIAYVEDPLTLFLCSDVIKIFTPAVLKRFCVDNTADLSDDDKLFELSNGNPLNLPLRTYRGKTCVNFIDYAKRVNSLIEDTLTSPDYTGTTDPNLSIISIADSNYGDECCISISYLNICFLACRGTYSSKTAQSYTQLSTISPKTIDQYGDKALGGIGKIDLEIAKTTLNAMLETANELYATTNKKVVLAIMGHSLGGAIATLKSLELLRNNIDEMIEAAKSDDPQNPKNPFLKINPVPICVTFGAPRVLGKNSNDILCGWITNKQLVFTRCSNHGDPVTSVPSSQLGYYHPCSDSSDTSQVNTKKNVLEECNSPVSVMKSGDKLAKGELPVTVVYTKEMNCTDDLWGLSIYSGMNASDHMVYYYVSFAKAADVKSLVVSLATSTEIARINNTRLFSEDVKITKGDTELRLIFMQGNSEIGKYHEVFLDLKNLETPIPETITRLTSAFNRDNLDTSVVFDMLSKDATNISVQQLNTKPPSTKFIPVPFNKTNKTVIDSQAEYDELITRAKIVISPNSTPPSPAKKSMLGINFFGTPKSAHSATPTTAHYATPAAAPTAKKSMFNLFGKKTNSSSSAAPPAAHPTATHPTATPTTAHPASHSAAPPAKKSMFNLFGKKTNSSSSAAHSPPVKKWFGGGSKKTKKRSKKKRTIKRNKKRRISRKHKNKKSKSCKR
jgi:hypothetical protein